MSEQEWLARHFQEHRMHLQGVAYRMLGSLSEADDAVQEAWLRVTRADTSAVENLGGWLTTVVARVSLDMLRSRASRREESFDVFVSEGTTPDDGGANPERETMLADSVGLALLVVLDTLAPAERLAFVLHDMFDVPFEEIARIVGRTPAAARQLASRARRRVRGGTPVVGADVQSQRHVVDQFLAALRTGDLERLIALLDPELVVRTHPAPGQTAREVRGARVWATSAIEFSRALRGPEPGPFGGGAQAALVDGRVGLVVAPRGRLFRVLQFDFQDGRIARIDVVVDPARLRQLELAVLEG
jgi:RNA polymerase sigma-70 factor (ECF subfamily)